MATDVLAGGLGEGRIASTLAGGTALTVTPVFIRMSRGTTHVMLTPRNFATAVVAYVHFNPWLTVLKATDALATAPTDYSVQSQDKSAAAAGVVLSSLTAFAVTSGGRVYVGSKLPIRGLAVDVQSTNSTATSTITAYYTQKSTITAQATSDAGTKTQISCTHAFADGHPVLITGTKNYNGVYTIEQTVSTTSFVIPKAFVADEATGTAYSFKSIGATDGTKSSTALDQDGNITWTVPTDHAALKLSDLYPTSANFAVRDIAQYWHMLTWDKDMDSSTTLNSLVAMNRDAALYNEFISGQTIEQRILHGTPGGIGCIEARVNGAAAESGSLIVNTFTERDGSFA
jgi:hypothetical protein